MDRLGELAGRPLAVTVLEAFLPMAPIHAKPALESSNAHPHLLGDQFLGEALFEVEFDGPESFGEGPGRRFFSRPVEPCCPGAWTLTPM